jgi:hypothetical protein
MSKDFRGLIHRSIATLGLALIAATIAHGQTLTTSFLPGTDFSKYHTYQWVKVEPHPNPDVDAEIKRIVDMRLAAKGLTKTDNKPDLMIGYRVAGTEKEEWPYYRSNEIAHNTESIIVVTGTLGIEMRDAARDQIVWTGTATKAVDPHASTRQKQGNLDKVIQKMLERYPPKLRSKK